MIAEHIEREYRALTIVDLQRLRWLLGIDPTKTTMSADRMAVTFVVDTHGMRKHARKQDAAARGYEVTFFKSYIVVKAVKGTVND